MQRILPFALLVSSFAVGVFAFWKFMNSSPASEPSAAFWSLLFAFGIGLLSCIHLLRSRNPIFMVVAILSLVIQSGVMFVVLLPPR